MSCSGVGQHKTRGTVSRWLLILFLLSLQPYSSTGKQRADTRRHDHEELSELRPSSFKLPVTCGLPKDSAVTVTAWSKFHMADRSLL